MMFMVSEQELETLEFDNNVHLTNLVYKWRDLVAIRHLKPPKNKALSDNSVDGIIQRSHLRSS